MGKKVAVYCRVGATNGIQKQLQTAHYTDVVRANPQWDFVGVYADYGTKGRDGFTSMLEDALSGRIDYIITKNLSRFSRNTVDCLKHIRLLREHGVGIVFEVEGIDTLNPTNGNIIEMLATFTEMSGKDGMYETDYQGTDFGHSGQR